MTTKPAATEECGSGRRRGGRSQNQNQAQERDEGNAHEPSAASGPSGATARSSRSVEGVDLVEEIETQTAQLRTIAQQLNSVRHAKFVRVIDQISAPEKPDVRRRRRPG